MELEEVAARVGDRDRANGDATPLAGSFSPSPSKTFLFIYFLIRQLAIMVVLTIHLRALCASYELPCEDLCVGVSVQSMRNVLLCRLTFRVPRTFCRGHTTMPCIKQELLFTKTL